MEKMVLVMPASQYAGEIVSFRQEFIECGSSMDGCGSLEEMENPEDWLRKVERYHDERTVPENRVVSTLFLYVRQTDSRLIGMIEVRHYLSEALRKYFGHIGYSVRPSERRKGYAKRMLQASLPGLPHPKTYNPIRKFSPIPQSFNPVMDEPEKSCYNS